MLLSADDDGLSCGRALFVGVFIFCLFAEMVIMKRETHKNGVIVLHTADSF